MAGDWIKIETTIHDKPEVWAIAAALQIDSDAVVGKLAKVWIWFDKHTSTGNANSVTSSVAKALLDHSVGVSGFCNAMVEVGWMQDDGVSLSLPKFERHNGQTAKTRAETNKRVAKHRNAKSVTDVTPEPLPEKRREEKRTEEKRREDIPRRRSIDWTTTTKNDFWDPLVEDVKKLMEFKAKGKLIGLDRDTIWNAHAIGSYLDRDHVRDIFRCLVEDRKDNPKNYLATCMKDMCDAHGYSWDACKHSVPKPTIKTEAPNPHHHGGPRNGQASPQTIPAA
jgi:hypothetical protein